MEIIINDEIDRGQTGVVFNGLLDQQPVAIKIINIVGANEKKLNNVHREIEIRKILGNHPHLINIHKVEETSEKIMIIMDLVPNAKTLRQFSASLRDLIPIMRDLTVTLDYIHSKSVIHGDIKPENILINTETFTAYIIDLACVSPSTEKELNCKPTGTPIFTAPEILIDKSINTFGSDVYSLGATFYYMFNKRSFIPDWIRTLQALIRYLQTNSVNSNSGDREIDNIIRLMMLVDPNERIGLKKVMELLDNKD